MKKWLIIAIVIIVASGAVFLIFGGNSDLSSLMSSPKSEKSDQTNANTEHVLRTAQGVIVLEIASSTEAQEMGLSGRPSLPDDRGMLFVFEYPGIYSFWMKDMLFPLDIIWIDASKTIVQMNSNIAPETYPDTFVPSSEISYVLELNAESAERYGLVEGQVLDFTP